MAVSPTSTLKHYGVAISPSVEEPVERRVSRSVQYAFQENNAQPAEPLLCCSKKTCACVCVLAVCAVVAIIMAACGKDCY